MHTTGKKVVLYLHTNNFEQSSKYYLNELK